MVAVDEAIPAALKAEPLHEFGSKMVATPQISDAKSPKKLTISMSGGMAERLKAPVLKFDQPRIGLLSIFPFHH